MQEKTIKPPTWNPEMDEAMKKYILDGWSGAQIADAINKDFKLKKPITRNAVIGRSNRIGFSISSMKQTRRKVDPKKKDRKITIKVKRNPVDKSVPAQIPLERYAPPPAADTGKQKNILKGVRFADLGSCQCRWTESMGHPSQFLFCGEPTKVGISYCAEHLDRVYLKTPKKY